MNKSSYTRQNSLGQLKNAKQQPEYSQFLKPIPQSASLVESSSANKFIRRKKLRTRTITSVMSSELPSNETSSETFAKSCNSSPLEKKNYTLETQDSQETIKLDLTLETIRAKFGEKFKDIDSSDLKRKVNAYFAIFDLVIIADREFGQFISILKDGLLDTLNEIHHLKTSKLNRQLFMLKENIQDLTKDRENIITKLSVLSNENMNLLKYNEKLSLKCINLEMYIKKCIDNKSNPIVMLEELQQKSEKIRELSNKISDLHKNEAKMLKITDEFKAQGIDFEKVYAETNIYRNFPELKLTKKNVPILRINTLK